MAETTYHIEYAPSSRSKCKKCKQVITKGELRIATNSYKESADMNFTSYQKIKCFNVPPRAMKGVSPEEFVDDHLEDQTNDSILSDETKRREVIDAIAYKPPKGAKVKMVDESPIGKRLAEIKAAMEKLPSGDEENEDARPTKKAKKGGSLEACARAFSVYENLKSDDLKSLLRWNLGYGMTGNKEVLLLRCIDGHANGRLARCATCFKGKLQLKDEDAGATIVCKGYFDEELQQRIPCSYSVSAGKAPRLQPWYSDQPSEEEMKSMKDITEKHAALFDGKGGDGTPQELIDAAERLDWPIENPKERAMAILDVCTSYSAKVDLPQDEKKARIAVGKLLMNLVREDPAANAVEALDAVVKEFGIATSKAEAKAKQKSALGSSCACAANAGIVQAFQELGDLYFKDGNSNAGLSYKKAVASLSSLEYEITADNAKGLGKGKTKVAGIGKGSAEKIHEFFTTGTIQKLEEKRMIHS